jgi:hypothetical protein
MSNFVEYSKVYDLLNQDKKYQEECEFVYRWASMPNSIIDIGCGTANYWKYFPVRPLGIEKSKEMILQSEYFKDILCEDITEFTPPRNIEFDCAIALFDVLNYIHDHSWWENLPIKKGGYFIFDIWDMEKVKEAINTNNYDLAMENFLIYKKFLEDNHVILSVGINLNNIDNFNNINYINIKLLKVDLFY